jgi:hypothetical protein
MYEGEISYHHRKKDGMGLPFLFYSMAFDILKRKIKNGKFALEVS